MTSKTKFEEFKAANARWERFIARGTPNNAWIAKSERLYAEADRAWVAYLSTAPVDATPAR